MPPDSPSFCVHANVCTRVQVTVSRTNANFASVGPELMGSLKLNCHWVAYPSIH